MVTTLVFLVLLFSAVRVGVSNFSGKSRALGATGIEGEARLADCPGTPNCVSTQADDPDRRVKPLTYTIAAGDVMPAIARTLTSHAQADIVTESQDYLHATFRTPLMGFTDDVEFLRTEGGSVQIRSASRLGKSDLGANRKRVESLRQSLAQTLGAQGAQDGKV